MADKSSPVAVLTDGIFTQVTAGLGSGYGLRADGAVFAWGDNTYGQLGDGDYGLGTSKASPVSVVGGHRFQYIAAGWNHILGLKLDGSLFSWGKGDEGQLGRSSDPILETGSGTEWLTPDVYEDFHSPLDVGSGFDDTLTWVSGFFCRYGTCCLPVPNNCDLMSNNWEHGQEGEQFGIAHQLEIIDPVSEFGGFAPKYGLYGARERHSGGLTWVLESKLGERWLDFDILALVRLNGDLSSNFFSGVVGRVQDITTAGKTFYRFGFNGTNQEGCSLEKYVGGAYTQLALVNGGNLQFCVENPTENNCPGNGWANGEWWWCRLNIEGSNIKGKIWPYGWSMPVGWDINVVDTSIINNGSWGISAEWAALGNWGHFFDWIGAAGNGNEVITTTPGDFYTVNNPEPTSPVGGHSFVKVDAGECHSIGLKADGSVWTWGCNESGQLATQLQAGAIGAGALGYGSAIDENGVLWMWGSNTSGQLGDNSTTNRSSPVTVAGPQGWGIHPQIPQLGMDPCLVPGNCGGIGQHSDNLSWATKTDGSLWMWGDQNQGQLGVGNWTTNYSSPVSVLLSIHTKFFAVASTGGHPASTYALGSDGHIYVWGYTGYILGGTAAPLSVNSPIKVESYIFDARGPFDPFVGRVFRYISAGVFGGLAGSGTKVWVWGNNDSSGGGRICTGDVVNHSSPLQISGIWTHAAHGGNNTILIDPAGNVYGCGNNAPTSGMSPPWFGGGGPVARSTPTIIVGAPHNAIKVAAAQQSQYFGFLRADGSLFMWGENNDGELGVGDTVSRTSPTSVLGSGQSYSFVDFVIGGESGTVAIDTEGKVWGWGQWGHVGNNTTTNRVTPTQTLLNPITPEEFRSSPTRLGDSATGPFFTDIAAGNQHNLALKQDGSAWAWGSNTSGQLGIGTIQNAIAPQSVIGGLSFIDIAAGIDFSYALQADETIWAWGDNTCGKLGDGTTTDKSSPVSILL